MCVDKENYAQVVKNKKNPPVREAENMGYLLRFGTTILT
jgi:hypothetical protein